MAESQSAGGSDFLNETMTDEIIVFKPSANFSLGVEIEFQIIDADTYTLVPLGPALQERAPDLLQPRITQELIKSILEIQTGICRDVRDVENDLLQTCSLSEELAAENRCLLYAASLHPFARASEQVLSNDARYRKIMDELQIVGRRFISQGLHVHVGVPDQESAIRVCNTIQGLLPVFLALSASSPYYQGEDTGLMSYRTKLFEALPLAGIYEYMDGWDHFVSDVELLKKHNLIDGVRDLWWDARPSPHFGTIEVRICDLPTRFSDILAIVSLIQATVAWIVEEKIETSRLNPYLLKANKWQALRYGLNGTFVDTTSLLSRESMNIRSVVERLFHKIYRYSEQLQSHLYLEGINNIVSQGTGADRQRTIYEQTRAFTEVVRITHQGFWK